MKISIFVFLLFPCLCFSQINKTSQYTVQKESNKKKFTLQLDGGIHLTEGSSKCYGTEASLNYEISDNIFAGAGFLYAAQYSYDFYSPYGQITFKSSAAKIAPYGKIACGANFSSADKSWPGVYFAIGAGAEYKLTDKFGITAELTHKSFSFHHEYIMQIHYPDGTVVDGDVTTGRPYYSFFAPYIGVNLKF